MITDHLDMAGQVAIVTGGATGIGYATALQIADGLRHDVHREHDVAVLVDARPDRHQTHLAGLRLLQTVQQIGPGKGAAVDQRVRLPRFGRCEFDLFRIDGRPQARRLLPQVCGAALIACRPRGELRVAAGVAKHARDVEGRREHRDGGDHEQPEMNGALVVERPRGKIRSYHMFTRCLERPRRTQRFIPEANRMCPLCPPW